MNCRIWQSSVKFTTLGVIQIVYLVNKVVTAYQQVYYNSYLMKLLIPGDVDATGKYTIKAKNKWGECESSAKLTIVLRPEIEGPRDVKVVPGDSAEFIAVVQANPVPEIVWTRDDNIVEESDNIKIIEDKVNKTYKLIVDKVSLANEGHYKITAKNELGETSSEATLRTISESLVFCLVLFISKQWFITLLSLI